MSRLTVAVTGAQGYAGSLIANALEARGHTVVELVRRPKIDAPRKQVMFDLSQQLDPSVLRDLGVNGLIHVAWDFKQVTSDTILRVNRNGSIRLFDSFLAAGGGTGIFISTIAAFDGAKSLYGQIKRETEQEALQRGFWVVRPGLIQGDEPGGIVGVMLKLVKKLPIVPVLGYGKRVLNPIEASVLSKWVSQLVEAPPPSVEAAIVVAARPERQSLDEIVRSLIQKNQLGRRLLIPLPWQPVWLALRTAEALGLKLNLRSDSIISLMNQNPNPTFSDPPVFS